MLEPPFRPATQVFSYYYCHIFKTYFEEHLQTAASAPTLAVLEILLFVAEKQGLLILEKRTTISIIATNRQVRHNFVFAKQFSYESQHSILLKVGH